jgi:rhodanese-related sulfurtransferase
LRGSRGRRPETAKEDRVTRNISREELKEKMDRGEEFFLVDTLEEPYYRHSHLPGAINIPLEEIERAPEAIPDKGAEIVVYCMDPP